MYCVVVSESLHATCADWLNERTNMVRSDYRQTERLRAVLAEANGLVIGTYTKINEALLTAAPKLRVVGRAGVGLENVDLTACRQSGVRVVYTPEANTHAVAEYVIALMLDALRPRVTIGPDVDAETFHRFRRELIGTQLDTLTLGILGLGRIGRRVSRIAHGLGMTVLAHDLLPPDQLRQRIDHPVQFVDQATLLGESDVLTVHVDGRPENRHLLNQSRLSQLKPGCLLINTSRGMVIDSADLAAWARIAVDTGGRAVLDVHEPEPIPPPSPQTYPLYGLSNVRLLPHIASRTSKALENMS
ncbi:MAG: NAD(P)-dependent oxidoreductase, partial [Pirellulaceae bacterium]|nr:NAD(P)-dependent oxidoreductase [Pirellulaceae bacterium]